MLRSTSFAIAVLLAASATVIAADSGDADTTSRLTQSRHTLIEAIVFADKEHLTRSAAQLTLMQLTRMGLADIVAKAAAGQAGTAYSAIPAVRDGKPVVVVKFATADGKSHVVVVSLN
jgi:hypothetical protein